MDALKPYLKSILVLVATVAAVVLEWAITGNFNTNELWTAVGGFGTALGVYAVPNTPRPLK